MACMAANATERNDDDDDKDGGNVNVNVNNDSRSDSHADSSSTSSSESSSGSTSTSDNNVAVTFTSPSSTTVRNVASPDTPNVYPSAPCRIARSAGLSLAGGAISGGVSIEDPECTLRETARAFQYLGVPEIGLHLLCTNSIVINGRRDKKGELEKGEPPPIGVTECLRLVREFQGSATDESGGAEDPQLAMVKEQHDRVERELYARLDTLEQALDATNRTPPKVTLQTVQQPVLTTKQKQALQSEVLDK